GVHSVDKKTASFVALSCCGIKTFYHQGLSFFLPLEKCGLMKRIDKLTEKELQALHQNFLSCTNIRETEAALRQHLGLSKSKAKQHAGPMFQHNQEARETLRQ